MEFPLLQICIYYCGDLKKMRVLKSWKLQNSSVNGANGIKGPTNLQLGDLLYIVILLELIPPRQFSETKPN